MRWTAAWLVLELAPVSAQIHILSPGSLINEFASTHGHIYGTTATFGTPYYGERVVGRLRYTRPKTNHFHCTDGGYEIPDLGDEDDKLRIVVVDRGECTFVTKVRIAQEYKHAKAVIVVDNTDMSSEDIQHIIMADDGWGGGSKVQIPSIMVSRQEGDKLKNAVESGQNVVVELAWDIPTSNVVAIDFWMSSGSREAGEFLDRLKPYVDDLQYRVQFTPHFHVFSLPSLLNNLCSDSTGKFCAPDPDGSGPITGHMVVEENVRQLCIYMETKVSQNVPGKGGDVVGTTYSPKYWGYLSEYHHQCPVTGAEGAQPAYRFGPECSTRVQKSLGLDANGAITRCVREKHDALLQEEHDNVAWSPLALRINGWRYSGPLDPITVLKTVCSGFLTPPSQCEDYESMRYTIIRHLSGIELLHALAVFAVLILFMGFLFIVYKRYLQKSVRSALREEVMLEVRSQMQDYQALDDGGPSRGHMF